MTNSTTSYIYDNYNFEFEFDDTTINIKLTDTEQLDLYETTINHDDINVKPIKRFIFMIDNMLTVENPFFQRD